MFKAISNDTTGVLVEKKSKFIADVFYVESELEAEEKLKEIRKKYYDAKHHCFAYSIHGESGVINKYSDDGEPSGTAGSPLLNIINSEKIENIIVIVTRYFGGILLGTGGLVRAYTDAFKIALENVKLVDKDFGNILRLKIMYSDFEKLKYYLQRNEIKVVNVEYDENVYVTVEATDEKYEQIISNKNDLSFEIIDIEVVGRGFIEV